MGRICFVLVLLLGCAREPLEEPALERTPPTLIPKEGASLYVLEGPAGWIAEDLKILDPQLTEAQLATVLRYGLSNRQVHFIGHADFQPTSGWPTDATLFNPDAEGHGRRNDQVGFKVSLTATPMKWDWCRLEWKAEQVRIFRPKPGAATETETTPIASTTSDLPFRKSIVVSQPKEGGREYTLLLRVASLKPSAEPKPPDKY